MQILTCELRRSFFNFTVIWYHELYRRAITILYLTSQVDPLRDLNEH
jgi:hypothetical protein